jgi:hypothetical protein
MFEAELNGLNETPYEVYILALIKLVYTKVAQASCLCL